MSIDEQPTGGQRMNILAIDPGPEKSAYVLYSPRPECVERAETLPNEELLDELIVNNPLTGITLVIEQVACMGMAVGAEVFETVFWSGRFAEVAHSYCGEFHRVKRHQVKMHLCGNMRATDANIRASLIDRFGPGKEKAIGKKKCPGPLFEIAGDEWQALALAVTFADTMQRIGTTA